VVPVLGVMLVLVISLVPFTQDDRALEEYYPNR
jgi:hypothetical protein